MPETKFTVNRNLPSPTGKDFVPEGPAEIEALAKAMDEENTGDIDFLKAGVVQSTDWSFTASMENSATCALASTGTTGGVAWLPNATIGLVRSSTTPATLKGLIPASKPAASKYMSVGFQITPATWGAAATVSVVSGVEKATQAEAEAAPAGEVSGKLRLRDVVILNTAGVYSIVHQTERRVWATGGAVATESVAEGAIGAEAVTDAKVKKGTLTGDKFAFATGTFEKKTFTEAEVLAGVVAHATRPTWVTVNMVTKFISEIRLEVEGMPSSTFETFGEKQIFQSAVMGLSTGGAESLVGCSALVPAGKKWFINWSGVTGHVLKVPAAAYLFL